MGGANCLHPVVLRYVNKTRRGLHQISCCCSHICQHVALSNTSYYHGDVPLPPLQSSLTRKASELFVAMAADALGWLAGSSSSFVSRSTDLLSLTAEKELWVNREDNCAQWFCVCLIYSECQESVKVGESAFIKMASSNNASLIWTIIQLLTKTEWRPQLCRTESLQKLVGMFPSA